MYLVLVGRAPELGEVAGSVQLLHQRRDVPRMLAVAELEPGAAVLDGGGHVATLEAHLDVSHILRGF